ncbi:hypothetical protein CUT44_07780, partial [Streptomyces carminius]
RLERMRLADPAYAGDRSGPLTWALLVEIAGRYENWQTGLAGSRSEIVVLRELLGKALNPRAGAPGMTLTGFIEQSAALAEPADPLPAALDPAAWDDGPLPGGQNVQPSPAQPLPAQPSQEEQAGPSGTPRDGSDPAPVFPESGAWNSPGADGDSPMDTEQDGSGVLDAFLAGESHGDIGIPDLDMDLEDAPAPGTSPGESPGRTSQDSPGQERQTPGEVPGGQGAGFFPELDQEALGQFLASLDELSPVDFSWDDMTAGDPSTVGGSGTTDPQQAGTVEAGGAVPATDPVFPELDQEAIGQFLASLDELPPMDFPWEDMTAVPQPTAEQIRLEQTRLLNDTVGVQVGEEGFDHYLAMLKVLDALRASDAAFSQGPMDSATLARMALRISHLADWYPLTGDDYKTFFTTVSEAVAAGRADTVAAVAAFHLDRYLGVLSGPGTVHTAIGQLPGRNWGGLDTTFLNPDFVGTFQWAALPTLVPAKWAGRRPYVLVAAGDHRSIMVTDMLGGSHPVGAEELAELLRHDPAMPPDGPVVFLVSRAGAGGLELPRWVADRLGGQDRTVWSTDGELFFHWDLWTGHQYALLNDRDPGNAPVGKWIPSRPGYVLPPGTAPGYFRTVDGREYPDSRLMRYTLLTQDGEDVHGWVSMTPQDMAIREQDYAHLSAVRHFRRVYVNKGDFQAAVHPLEGPDVGYSVAGHSNEQEIALVLDDGSQVIVSGEQVGGIMRRRPSFRQLPADKTALALFCLVGASAPNSDPLVVPVHGQAMANAAGKAMRASNSSIGSKGPVDTTPPTLQLLSHADEPDVMPRMFHPEPTGPELLRLAGEQAGLGHLPPGEQQERVLRMVRAISEIFGIPPRPRLLEAFGVLERMRLADPGYANGEDGPLTWKQLQEIAFMYELHQAVPFDGRPQPELMREMLSKALALPADARGTTLSQFLMDSGHLPLSAEPLPAALVPANWQDGPLPAAPPAAPQGQPPVMNGGRGADGGNGRPSGEPGPVRPWPGPRPDTTGLDGRTWSRMREWLLSRGESADQQVFRVLDRIVRYTRNPGLRPPDRAALPAPVRELLLRWQRNGIWQTLGERPDIGVYFLWLDQLPAGDPPREGSDGA